MARRMNPFTATLGSTPRYVAGRDTQIADFGQALQDGPGSHERITVVSGPRGVGKTVLLNAFEDVARANGWWVISETATAGFTQRITDAVMRHSAHHREQYRKTLTGISIAGVGGVQFSVVDDHRPHVTVRDALTELLTLQAAIDAQLGQEPVGILLTLDELHYMRHEEIVDFGAAVQHLVREGREIAVAMAGIPQAVAPLLAAASGNNPVTFLRRASRIELRGIPDDEVRDALRLPIEEVGMSWTGAALDQAAAACGGYPFMIQLVGQECFRKCRGTVIEEDHVREGLQVAQRKLEALVHEPALADLSQRDRDFLMAMVTDQGPSAMSDIAQRLGVDPQYAGTYRRRLMKAEMIEAAGHGRVRFALPYLREYLAQLRQG